VKRKNPASSHCRLRGDTGPDRLGASQFLIAAIVVTAFIWDYWPTIVVLMRIWREDRNYSGGVVVPIIALWLLWRERTSLHQCRQEPCWWGIVLLLLGHAAQIFGITFLYGSIERYSLVLTIAGTVLLIAGWQVFYRTRWILIFLFLMMPLPARIHEMVSNPLQTQATAGAVFFLELFGEMVVREGNVIVLNDDIMLGFAEACSGLSMLTAFIIVASVFVFIIKCPWWQKFILLISSVPVAIACNLIRLVVTAELYQFTSQATAEKFFHDFAGLLMVPLAVLILVGEFALLNVLVSQEADASQIPPSGKVKTP